MTEASGNVSALVEKIAKWIVDAPDEVYVDHLDGDVIELEVAEADVGKIIGRQGRNVRALRTLLKRRRSADTEAIHAGCHRLTRRTAEAWDRTIRDPETSGEFITLARVVKTQGRRGEVAAEIFSQIPDRFTVGMKLLALPRGQKFNAGNWKWKSFGRTRDCWFLSLPEWIRFPKRKRWWDANCRFRKASVRNCRLAGVM